jgi:para-aminobenzoate synthetase component II
VTGGIAPGSAPATRILVVDNYDSFVFTIVGYLQQLGAECDVVRNDAVTPARGADYDGVLVSPGPGTPEEAGVSMAMIEACAERAQPMLGVCLGHQALGAVCGASVVRAPELLHGKTSLVSHDGTGVLAGLASPFTATRYHSLTIDPPTMPESLLANGQTESGVIMAVRHASLPLHGVQFHPESVLTEGGHRILANWLAMCGMPGAVEHADGLSPLVRDAEGVARMVSAG